MKTIVFFAILGFISAVPQYETDRIVEVRGLIEDGINNTINDILANLTDTISLDSLPIDFGDNDVLSGGLNVTSLNINGIKKLVASKISLNIFTLALDMNLHLSELLINFKYWADMLLLELVPLYGEGRMNLALEDLDLSIAGAANLTGGLTLKNITVGISLGDATFDLNGLINNPEFSALVSTALNDNFVTFVNKNSEVISSVISPIIEMILNAVLGGGDSDDPDNVQQLQQLVNEYRGYYLN